MAQEGEIAQEELIKNQALKKKKAKKDIAVNFYGDTLHIQTL